VHGIEWSKSRITCEMLQDLARSHTTVLTRASLLKTWNLQWSTYTDTWAAERSWWYPQTRNTQRSPSSKTPVDPQRSATTRLRLPEGPKHGLVLWVPTRRDRAVLWLELCHISSLEGRQGVLFLEKIEMFIFHARHHLGQRIKHLLYFLF